MKSKTFKQRIMAVAMVAAGLCAGGALLNTQAVAAVILNAKNIHIKTPDKNVLATGIVSSLPWA